jgi:hypothetical protein
MRFLKNYTLTLLVLATTAFLIPACQDIGSDDEAKTVSNYDYKIVRDWNNVFLEVERYAEYYRPGPAPRALAYLGLSAYEACIKGMPEYNSLANLYAGLNIPAATDDEYHWPTVVNASYAYLMPRFFPHVSSDLKQKITDATTQNFNIFQSQVSPEVFERSKNHGEAVAAAIWAWAITDTHGDKAWEDPFRGYDWQAHYDGPGDWVATTPGPGNGLFPYWGQVRRFALPESAMLSKPPLAHSESPTSQLYAQALEVYSQNTPTLSYETEWVGEFWSDDLLNLTFSPPARWIAVANQVYEKENADLQKALVTNAKVGMAINDAGVGCWHSKYYYNFERPETYIRRVIDPTWKTNLYNPLTGEESLTPSFPAYPSGHATFGAAAAEALASEFGYNYAMTDRCHENRTEFEGKPRTFGSFYEMALENGWSRVPLGVHFRMDSEEGVAFGTRIGRFVNDLPWKK